MRKPMNDIPIKRRKSEEGIGVVIVLLAVLVVIWGMRSLYMDGRQAKEEAKKIGEAFEKENSYRFVHQMIADDELCSQTDFMTNPPFADKLQITGTLAAPKPLAIARNFVNLSAQIGQSNGAPSSTYRGNWPGSGTDAPSEDSRTLKDVHGTPHSGQVQIISLSFYQPPSNQRKVLVTTVNGIKRTRVPVDVHNRAKIGGAEIDVQYGIETYVEFEGDDYSTPKACYKAVSSRSLCLDMGKIYKPGTAKKCE